MQLNRPFDNDNDRFNMTPVIDIVFLLIIFFMIVCQFIVAENFQVDVPNDISSAQRSQQDDQKTTTVTVMADEKGQIAYAVGSQIIALSAKETVEDQITAEIDIQLTNLPEQKRVVALRIDKDIPFKDSRSALAGIAQSTATDIKLSVITQKIAP